MNLAIRWPRWISSTALAVVCGACTSGGQTTHTGPVVGTACTPAVQAEGCNGASRLRCEGVWNLIEVCAPGQYCALTAAPDGQGVVSQCAGTPLAQGGGEDSSGGGTEPAGGDEDASPGGGSSDSGSGGGGGSDSGGSQPADVQVVGDTATPAEPEPPPAFAASGTVSGVLGNQPFSLDYDGLAADISMTHRIATSGPTCAPLLSVGVQRPDGSCRLQLDFALGSQAGQLTLVSAEFHAVTEDGQGQPMACAGWPYEQTSPVVYKLASGAATLAMPQLPQPQAAAPQATIQGLKLQPSGEVVLQAGAKKWLLKLGQLQFAGVAQSVGSSDPALICAQPKPPEQSFPMPKYKLTDVNPKSATYKQQLSLQDFAGKRIAVLLGAGWCASCVAQGEGMQKLKNQLGADTVLLVLHEKNSASSAANMYKNLTIPVLQGTPSMDPWALHGGKKNDGFFYDTNGKKLGYFQGAGTIYTNVWEQWLSASNTAAVGGKGGYNCANGGAPGQFSKVCTVVP